MTIRQEVLAFAREAAKWIDPRDVAVALDVGSLDGEVSRHFRSLFPRSRICAFECNPAALETCRRTLGGLDRAQLVEAAVCDSDGEVEFHPIDPARTRTPHPNGNIGASSLFLAAPGYPHEQYAQSTIRVPSLRIDTWAAGAGIPGVDVLWMDVQGAELLVLRGMGVLLSSVRIIHTEVEFKTMYTGQPLFPDVDAFLREAGFVQRATMYRDDWFGNLVYVRSDIVRRSFPAWIMSRLRVG
ncbi:MAG: FkbM family methyltransferase [Ignavibacteria bacterium]|nr:FkbM family methyltransferase [Ignavibacteria bacterium]